MVIMVGDHNLFSQYQMGDLTLPNRIVMAPMTRSRAGDADVPGLTNGHLLYTASLGRHDYH
jgi:NADH:flavin oxidoreductases, Old Yellow Enzyme family